ncbi:MAG: hypothetical protein LM557_03920 [Desulfurococcaceae archaeon]|nr:hypothetical protein [Desulfurococcaceae archaeon]
MINLKPCKIVLEDPGRSLSTGVTHHSSEIPALSTSSEFTMRDLNIFSKYVESISR